MIRALREHKTQISADKRSAQLGDQFFARIAIIAKALLVKAAIQT